MMEIQITRVDGAIKVNPAPPYITTYLQYTHRSFTREHWKMVNHFEKKLLYTQAPDGGIITFQGFFNKLQVLVNKNKDKLTVVDSRTPMIEPDLQAVNEINWEAVGSTGLRDYQVDPVADFLCKAKEGCGIVNVSGGWGKTVMQAITYAAFHNLKHCILAVPLKEVFNQTYQKFVGLFPDKHIGRVGDGFNDISEDITLTTFKSLPKCPLEKCELLLVDEIQGTTGAKILEVLIQAHPIRIFGYTATDQNLFNNADKLIKGLFGERLVFVPYQEAQEGGAVVPCVVYFVKMPETAFIDAVTIESKIIKGIKRNEIRNKLIGAICNLVPENWQTLIFVDHIEDHLVKLYKYMPNGTKFFHRGSKKKTLGGFALSDKEQKEVIQDFRDQKFQYLIATDCARAGVDLPNVKVVVQASGGTSEIEILQEAFRGARTAPGKEFFVLIDIMDCHDGTLENMSLKRRDIYKKQGWVIKEVDSPKDIDWNSYNAPIVEQKEL